MTQEFGEVHDHRVYTAEVLAKRIGRSVRSTKEMLRDHFEIVDYGTLVLVSGLNFRLGIERMSRCSGEEVGEHPTKDARPRSRNRKSVKPNR